MNKYEYFIFIDWIRGYTKVRDKGFPPMEDVVQLKNKLEIEH